MNNNRNDLINFQYKEFSVIKLNLNEKKLTTMCNDENL